MEDAIKDSNQIEKENRLIKDYLEKCGASILYDYVISDEYNRADILKLEKQGYIYDIGAIHDFLQST